MDSSSRGLGEHLCADGSLPVLTAIVNRERPSRHGAITGRALSAMAEAGGVDYDDTCITCAFRPGCMTNQMAATGLEAVKCAIGADPAEFACHHGMRDGQPIKLCAGYLAARNAPWDRVKAIVAALADDLAPRDEPDTVRAAFDAWIAKIDPDDTMDDYKRARLYAKQFPPLSSPAVIEGDSSRDDQK